MLLTRFMHFLLCVTRVFVPASVDPSYPNACYLKKAGGGWTVQAVAGVTSGTVQGLSVQVANNQPPPQNVTTVQTIYNTVSVSFTGNCMPCHFRICLLGLTSPISCMLIPGD